MATTSAVMLKKSWVVEGNSWFASSFRVSSEEQPRRQENGGGGGDKGNVCHGAQVVGNGKMGSN